MEELQKQIDELNNTILALRDQLRVMQEDRDPLVNEITRLRAELEK